MQNSVKNTMKMEISELNMISDFVSPLPRVTQVYTSFWKWGALILALIATFTSTFTRIKLFIIRVRSIKSSSSKHLLQRFDDDFDFSDGGDTSSNASEFDAGEISDSASSSDGEINNQFDDDFRVSGSISSEWRNKNGNSELRRRCSAFDLFSWSDFAAGKSVVKLWDSLGLGIDLEDSSESEISIWDLDKDQKINTFFARKEHIPAVSKSSAAVIYLSETSDSDRFLFGAYDRRMCNKTPEVYADWVPQPVNMARFGSGDKVYVNGKELTMGNLRNVRTPSNNLTESRAEMWWGWDADAVIN